MTEEQSEQMTDDEAIQRLAMMMKGNTPTMEDKQSVHQFLFNVVTAKDSRKVGNLRDDETMNELGLASHNVRGSLEMARISDLIMDNTFFSEFFKAEAEDTLATSLSRNGFIIKQATTSTRQVADVTKRRKINKGWFGSKKVEEIGGDTTGAA